jgi:hypothetical protein
LQSPRATQEPLRVRDAAAQVMPVLQARQVLPVLLVPQVPAAEAGRLFARMTRVQSVRSG